MSTKYDKHFKEEAINLALTSGQSYRQVAKELDLLSVV